MWELNKLKLIFASFLLLLTACSDTGGGLKNPNFEDSPTDDNKGDNNDITDDPKIEKDQVVAGDSWEGISFIFDYSLIEAKRDDVPSIEASRYEAYYTYNEDNEITYSYVKCFGVRAAVIVSLYEKTLKNNDFSLSSSYALGYKEVSLTNDLYIQYGLFEDEETHFDLMIYEVTTRVKEFPKETIKYYLGVDLIPFDAACYSIYQDFVGTNYSIRLLVDCLKTNKDNFEEYLSLLKDAEYSIELSQDMYFATSKDLLIKVVLYMYDESTVQLSITSSYPYSYEIALLGFSLPKFTNFYSNISYSFVYDEFDNETLAIYYEGVKEEDLSFYGNLLVEYGFENTYFGTSQGEYTITTATYIYNKDNSEHRVSLMYCKELNEICVAIFY